MRVTKEPLILPALLGTASLLVLAGGGRGQTIVRSFDGESGPVLAACQTGDNHCGRQPEMNAAANGKQVVQTTWQNVRVYEYQGFSPHH